MSAMAFPRATSDLQAPKTSVFAQVDRMTLEVIDQAVDQTDQPRSWLIAKILSDWARENNPDRKRMSA
jgi:hypothetical protein